MKAAGCLDARLVNAPPSRYPEQEGVPGSPSTGYPDELILPFSYASIFLEEPRFFEGGKPVVCTEWQSKADAVRPSPHRRPRTEQQSYTSRGYRHGTLSSSGKMTPNKSVTFGSDLEEESGTTGSSTEQNDRAD